MTTVEPTKPRATTGRYVVTSVTASASASVGIPSSMTMRCDERLRAARLITATYPPGGRCQVTGHPTDERRPGCAVAGVGAAR
jgi:hypothetical protein